MFSQLHRWLMALAVAFSLSLGASAARAQEAEYYMILFSYDGASNLARDAHTFATFIKVPDEEDDPEGMLIEKTTISWLPASLNIVVARLRPEIGRNLGLHETLRLASDRGARVSAWGPYRIRKDLYERGVAQAARLKSGTVLYKAIDRRFRPDIAINCIHAVSDSADGPLLDTGTTFGVAATRQVVWHLSPWFIEPNTTHRELIEPLRLDQYEITYRDEIFVAD